MKLLCCVLIVALAVLAEAQFSKYVDTTIGTGGVGFGIGSTPPGAQRPFGAARVGPDTVAFDDIYLQFNHFGGYYYPDSHIRVISHTHMVGAGVTDYGNIGVMAVNKVPSKSIVYKYGFRTAYDHSSEVISPGYYSVVYKDHNVKAEVTTTMHVGAHRYTYKVGDPMYLLMYISHGLQPQSCAVATATLDPTNKIITGYMLNEGGLSSRFGGIKTYFVAVFDQPVVDFGVWNGETVYDKTTTINGTDVGVYFGFGTATSNNTQVTLRVAISFISIQQAITNLKAEVSPSDTFDTILAATSEIWEDALSLIEVNSAATESHDNLVKFYTSLYHALMAPTVWSETNGLYLGFDGKIHTVDDGHSNWYTDMSIWDTHRTQFPLLALLVPDRMADIVQSLVNMYEQGGDIPRWPLGNGYTGCMIGTHADIVVADAYFKGIRNFDINTAYKGLKQAATTQQPYASRVDVADWMGLGWIPNEEDGRAVCNSLSYAFDDWAVGNIAGVLGLTEDQATFLNRSQNYKNVWDAKEQYFCPRNRDGSWSCPFTWYNVFDTHYVEGDALHWRWFVPHDPVGLISLFESKDYFISELTEFFERSEWDPTNDIPNPYYWAGNEPDIFAPYLFAFAGRPDLTQKYVRWNMDNKYTTQPDGLPGNDDYGTMSAWYIFGALGFYPQSGSPEGTYILGSPLFANVTVHLPKNDVQILAYNNSPDNFYVSKVALNSQVLTTPFVYHNNITTSNTVLEFWMTNKAN